MKTSRSRGKNVGGGKWGNTDSYFKTTDTHNSTQNNCLPPSRKWKQKKKKSQEPFSRHRSRDREWHDNEEKKKPTTKEQ